MRSQLSTLTDSQPGYPTKYYNQNQQWQAYYLDCLLDFVAIMLRTMKLFAARDPVDCNLASVSGSI